MSEACEGPALRIAFLSWRDAGHPEAGGAEVFLQQVSAELAARGHQVTVCCSHYQGAAAQEDIGGVRYVRRGGRATVYPRLLGWVAHRRAQFDVIIDVQNGLPFWTPLIGKPVANVTHHVHQEQWPEVFGPVAARVGWWLESRVAPRVYRRSQYFTVSGATRHDLARLGVDPARVAVGFNGLHDHGLPFALDEALRARAPVLIVLGRLVPHKRVEIAIDSVAALRARFPSISLSIIGGGYWRPTLERYAQERGVADIVHFAGVVDEATKRAMLAQAWVNLLPSLKEGWGLVVVEAGIHSTPTVAFRAAGGTTESVLDGATGRLVDDRAEFVAAVGDLIADEDELACLGAAARAHAARFTWASTTTALEATLHRALGIPTAVPLVPARPVAPLVVEPDNDVTAAAVVAAAATPRPR